jgi:predicted dehydrogenase
MEASCRYSRLRPKAKVVRDLISKGKLGNVYHIHNQMMLRDTFVDHNPKGVWGVNKKLAGGGPFIDWGCYDISFHLGVLGDAPKLKSLKTYTWNGLRKVNAPVADVEQHGAALMEFDTGLTYYYERGAGAHCEVASETRILGTKGGLKFSYLPWDPNQIQFFSTDKKGAPTQEIIEVTAKQHPEFGNVPLMTHFLACIQGKATSLMPLELAAKHLDILWRILR